jgi:hypothetical protein
MPLAPASRAKAALSRPKPAARVTASLKKAPVRVAASSEAQDADDWTEF